MIPAVAGFEGAPRLTIPPDISPNSSRLVHKYRCVVGRDRSDQLQKIVSISSGGPFSTANTNNSFVGRLARKPWRICTSTGAPCFVCGVEHFTCHYEGVSHAEWPKNEHE